MTEFSLDLLLKAIKLARWTYYYHLKQLDKIDRYGIEFVKKGKNRYYSPDLKQEMINKV
ncbi:degenerate transposase (Orf2) [Streptococcus pneumoniae]|nr:degenerate transposase (Orf2) [Streptococcus pneumoniae]